MIDSWRPETIELPPEFAPGLPKGVEKLRFAPGMITEGAEDFWSYVFVLEFDEKQETGKAWLLDLLEQYYSGLVEAVVESRELGPDRAPATVELHPGESGFFSAEIDLLEPFVTVEPLLLHVEIELRSTAERTTLLAAASPQPQDHPIWSDLHVVLAQLVESFDSDQPPRTPR